MDGHSRYFTARILITKIMMNEFEKSSFKRKSNINSSSVNSSILCLGIKTSVYTNRLVVSSGITSLDTHIGLFRNLS